MVLSSQGRTARRSGWPRRRWRRFAYRDGGEVPASAPGKLITDKAYGCDDFRAWLRRKGVIPCIPPRKNRTVRRKTWDEEYKERWHIERTFAWVRNFRRLFVRYERLISVNAAFLTEACLLICLRMVVK